jgi:hypothetical protein
VVVSAARHALPWLAQRAPALYHPCQFANQITEVRPWM